MTSSSPTHLPLQSFLSKVFPPLFPYPAYSPYLRRFSRLLPHGSYWPPQPTNPGSGLLLPLLVSRYHLLLLPSKIFGRKSPPPFFRYSLLASMLPHLRFFYLKLPSFITPRALVQVSLSKFYSFPKFFLFPSSATLQSRISFFYPSPFKCTI